jgi:hypothetical protein
MRLKRICLHCGKTFSETEKRIQIGRAKFCTQQCSWESFKYRYSKERHHGWQGGDIFKTCEICGKVYLARRYHVKIGRSKYCSKKCRSIALSIMLQGRGNSQWKGGVTLQIRGLRFSWEYKTWRDKVLIRDHYKCWICRQRGNFAHHIFSFSLFPELRFEIDNGRTLCRICHDETHRLARKGIFLIPIDTEVDL